MRQITSHLSHGGFNALRITAVDAPIMGAPSLRYDVTGFDTVYNPAAATASGHPAQINHYPFVFHSGPIDPSRPMNGLTLEALFAIGVDHLHSLQQGPDACMENQMALESVSNALKILHSKQAAQRQQGFHQVGDFVPTAMAV